MQARSAAMRCAEAAAWSLSAAETGAALTVVHQAEQALCAAKLHLVRQVDARGGATGGAVAWLRAQLRLSASAARRLAGLARAVDARPGVDAALSAGAMDAEQAGAVTAALDELPVEVGHEVHAKAEAMLVGWAGEFSAPALRRLGERVLVHVAPEVAEQAEARLLERAEQRAHAARTVSLRAVGAGRYRLTGVLDAEAAAIMTAALDPLCSPRVTRGVVPAGPAAASPSGGPAAALIPDVAASVGGAVVGGASVADAALVGDAGADGRSPGQRRADALIEVCRLALAAGDLPANGSERPQVTVTVPYDPVCRVLGAGTLDTGDRVSATQVRRLACDAQVIPAVLDGVGQVLDVGQSRRLFTGALRRALVLRDRGCTFPGCDRPPRWCEGHHIRSWVDGGPTSLDNAVLLCGRHHRTVHRGEWVVRSQHFPRPPIAQPAVRPAATAPSPGSARVPSFGAGGAGSGWMLIGEISRHRRHAMVTTMVRHRVRDFDTWRKAFSDAAPAQQAGGMTGRSVHRAADEPNTVLVVTNFATMADARAFVDRDDVRTAMQRAGVEGQPRIEFYDDEA